MISIENVVRRQYFNGVPHLIISSCFIFYIKRWFNSYIYCLVPFNQILFVIIILNQMFDILIRSIKDRQVQCIMNISCSISRVLSNICIKSFFSCIKSFLSFSKISIFFNNSFTLGIQYSHTLI